MLYIENQKGFRYHQSLIYKHMFFYVRRNVLKKLKTAKVKLTRQEENVI